MERNNAIYEHIPVVPLRGLVVLPGELLHFDAGRQGSVKALTAAAEDGSLVFLTSQKDVRKNEVGRDDIYRIGTVCRIRQVLNLPGDAMRVLVHGICRARFTSLEHGEYLTADAVQLDAPPYDETEAEALRRRLAKALGEYAALSTKLTADTAESVSRTEDAGAFADAVANVTLGKAEQRQHVLECFDVLERLRETLTLVLGEIEVLRVDRRISQEVKRRVDKNQKEYYLREQIKAIRAELGETDQAEADLFLERLEKKDMPDALRETVKKEIDRFRELPAGSHEQPQMRNYIECMLDLPWTEQTQDDLDLAHARAVLDADHYGLEKVKDRIVEHLAVARLTGKVTGQILCFVGPPGVGKTSVSESIARALGRNFVRMSLGGIHDEAEIRGHRRTYIGAMPGRIIQTIKRCGSSNPVIILDEVDKVTVSNHGDPSSALLEVLDPEQNTTFHDNYLDTEYDLSKVLFIATANNIGNINPALRDRMEMINIPGYILEEKVRIGLDHLLPKQMTAHGIPEGQLVLTPEVVEQVIAGYTRESGVRSLDKHLAKIARYRAKQIAFEEAYTPELTQADVEKILGIPKFLREEYEVGDMVGVVTGLAWTEVGGDILYIESVLTPGKGKVSLTGNLGEVMKESATIAHEWVMAHHKELGIDPEMFEKNDINIHVPEGAIPKDGPSAGITMVTSIVSTYTGRKVRERIAMTGETTLRGRVMPVGGIKEKILAAKRAGIKELILSEDNRKDISEIKAEYIDGLTFHYVRTNEDVLRLALEEKK